MALERQEPVARTEAELIQSVGEWADKNFGDRRGADWGIIEEMGEASHCILKAQQKIRGFDSEEYFQRMFADALADIIIYLCDWCYPRQAIFKFQRNLKVPVAEPEMQRRIMAVMLQTAGVMISQSHVLPGDVIEPAQIPVYNLLAQRMCTCVEQLAASEKMDLTLIVSSTWEKVIQRDWKQAPAGPLPELA